MVVFIAYFLIGCASMQANKKLNESPEDVARGDPVNNILVKEYLQNVLIAPEGRELRVYTRRAFSSDNKKNFFMFHMFYAYFKDNQMEHTLVFTDTPKGSELNGCWMLDAPTDLESYNLFLNTPENPWEVEEYQDSKGRRDLDMELTTKSILKRMDKGYTFFGPASIRNLPWYHLLWITLIPPLFSPEMLMLFSIHKDNCTSAILETIVFKDD
jgi:hypothetical protein